MTFSEIAQTVSNIISDFYNSRKNCTNVQKEAVGKEWQKRHNLKFRNTSWACPSEFPLNDICEVSNVTMRYKKTLFGKRPSGYFVACHGEWGLPAVVPIGFDADLSSGAETLKIGDKIRVIAKIEGCISSGYDRMGAFLYYVPGSVSFQKL